MCRQFMHVFCAMALSFFGFWGTAFAVSLGKVDVASHLGEPFYAEVPLNLDDGESIASVFVELASPSDYRILEVFRDGAVSLVRADVKSDSRGSRVELTSVEGIESPFFNLVLKVRHGHATHFKKFAVFLDLPRAARPSVATKAEVLPVKTASEIAKQETYTAESTTKTEAQASESAFKAYDGWARTAKYGPMVFGDTITTVAQRLRVDNRYTNQQVMIALFEKNKTKFGQGNINLIKAGTYLDVPSAREVEQITPQQALAELKLHNAKWKALTKQAKYARVQEAQQNRYSKRVRIGKSASGVASQPMAMSTNQPSEDASHVTNDATTKKNSLSSAVGNKDTVKISGVSSTTKTGKSSDALMVLRQENADLQKRLQEMETQVAKLSSQPTATEAMAASDAKIKKLELQLARQSAALEKARKQNEMQDSGQSMGMLTWILSGIIGLLVIIAGYLAYALRGQRIHPVQQEAEQVIEPEMDDVEEIEVEETMFDEDIETGEYSPQEEQEISHTIPELTDEDTSEIEAFQGLIEDADPNVDYLAEADVYMRYGMEDEAEKQVRTALQLREDNKDAHIKLAQILHARGDKSGLEEAIKAANSILVGDALASFTAAVDGLESGAPSDSEVSEGEVNLDDTLPPVEIETPVVAGVADIESEDLDMTDFELPDFSAAEGDDESVSEEVGVLDETTEVRADDISVQAEEAGAESNSSEHDVDDGLDFDLSDLEADFDEEVADESIAEADTEINIESEAEDILDMGDLDIDAETSMSDSDNVTSEAADDGLDFDLSDLDEKVTDESVAEPDTKTNIESEVVDDKTEALTITESDDSEDDFSLDLSDLELPEGDTEEEESEGSVASSFDTAELEKTVVMDWSKGVTDTSSLAEKENENNDKDIPDDTGNFDLADLSIDDESEVVDSEEGVSETADVETEALDISSGVTEGDIDGDMTISNLMSLDDNPSADETSESGEHVSSVELDLNDLDVDLDAAEHDDLEEFTSTIQATLSDLGVDDSEIEIMDSDDDHGVNLDALDLSLDGMESSDLLHDVSGSDTNDSIDNLDVGLELDDLLSDLDDENDKKDKS